MTIVCENNPLLLHYYDEEDEIVNKDNSNHEKEVYKTVPNYENKYLENYKRIKDLLVNRDVYLISDNLNKQFKNWIKLEFGWNHLTYHFHFDIDITITEFLKYPIEYKTNDFNKKIIIFNGNVDNEHKQFVKRMMTNLNLWDISYWSFCNDSNFGMEMYQYSKNLFLIFNK